MFRTSHEIEWEIYKGNRLLDKGKQEGHSYLKNWTNFIRAQFAKTRTPVVCEDGSSRDIGYRRSWCNSEQRELEFGFWMNSREGDASYGLVVGRGTTPPSPGDYKLEEKYPHGSGLGYLQYGSTKISDVQLVDNKLLIAVERSFYNDYKDPQDITEVGLIVYRREYGRYCFDVRAKFLIMRDVLDTALTVPAYATAVIRYNIYFIVG